MLRAMDKWLPGYLAALRRRPRRTLPPRHLFFCVADHFEPVGQTASADRAVDLVRRWREEYPRAAEGFRDADGRPPQHTFFYPQEECEPRCLALLGELCADGFGEVEIHLHHRHDTPGGFRAKLVAFRDRLRAEHGMLGQDRAGCLRYGFVHGNWALCNARPDGDWCGVNEELGILRETGCYADFTFPSAPSPTQPRMVNAIYYASDRPGKPRGQDTGRRAECRKTTGECLMSRPDPDPDRECPQSAIRNPQSAILMIQGPLALDWRRRKGGVLPRIENGAIAPGAPPVPGRVDLWVRQHIHVAGRPQWVFVKVHTHGCAPNAASVFLGGKTPAGGGEEVARRMYEHLQAAYNDGSEWVLHYVTAREMYNLVRAAEEDASRPPGECRDWEVGPPPCRRSPARGR